MKTIILSLSALVITAALLATSIGAAPTTAPSSQPTTMPINKMCAVMHDDPIDPAVTLVYQGKTIGFCCKDCVADFKKDPEKYMKDLK